ncbi:MAG: DNA methyltransferase, partial [Ktedonobacteraceae bacterium]
MARLTWEGKKSIDEQQLLVRPTCLRTLETVTAQGNEMTNAQPNNQWYNRLVCGDKKTVLPALLGEYAHSIDLIYIDPPFMTGRDFTSGNQVAYSDKWNNDLDTYLQWLYETLAFLHLLLAFDGCLYIHLDWRVTHYAKIILDEIFGFSANGEGPGFKSEIIWHYQSGGRSQKCYARKHDTLLLYTKSAQYCFH